MKPDGSVTWRLLESAVHYCGGRIGDVVPSLRGRTNERNFSGHGTNFMQCFINAIFQKEIVLCPFGFFLDGNDVTKEALLVRSSWSNDIADARARRNGVQSRR
uniref:Uncharacterized protein n=1 Tax=Grammatophora oceanica TaxID=210454 RepID=A0A7S1USH0_9STRA